MMRSQYSEEEDYYWRREVTGCDGQLLYLVVTLTNWSAVLSSPLLAVSLQIVISACTRPGL